MNCVSSADCPNLEACVIPEIHVENLEMKEKSDYLTRWMKVIKDINPEGIIVASDESLNDIMYIMEQIYFTPSVAISADRNYVVNSI